MFAVQGCKKVHFCQSVVFYFSREKYRVSDQTNCIHLWPCQSRVYFCKVTYHLRAGGFGRVMGATSSRFGSTSSKTIQFSLFIFSLSPDFWTYRRHCILAAATFDCKPWHAGATYFLKEHSYFQNECYALIFLSLPISKIIAKFIGLELVWNMRRRLWKTSTWFL